MVDKITLGDGELDVDQGIGFPQKVKGSRVVRHAPHGWVDEWRRQDVRPVALDVPPGHLFCHCCGDVRPKSYFQHDSSRKARGGYAYWCKSCEQPYDAQRKRDRYREEKAARGEAVRPYTRREKP